ncbi:uncharacterized protein LOC129612457 [Condylostylus longicornis]|uniref:uncharacterized protein LOC129612457 n=1 Tax=Condylostylus longicornis TaxID=2530218 RepID=UPI00244DBCA4|nr:uncharacterized protein LOC129612457 [Condylostylus longicornis]
MDGRIKFLLEASSMFEHETQANRLLRSYYLSNARKLFKYNAGSNIQLFMEKDGCNKCVTNWVKGYYGLAFESTKVNSRIKLAENLVCGKTDPIKHKPGAKICKKRQLNNLVFTCNFCYTKTRIPLQRRSKKPFGFNKNKLEVKAKEKNKNSESVSQTGNYMLEFTNETKIGEKRNRKLSKHINGSSSFKTSKLSFQSKSVKKKKGKPTGVSAVSKTQHKNTLLQLALLLKNNSNSNKSVQNNDRLKNLLK